MPNISCRTHILRPAVVASNEGHSGDKRYGIALDRQTLKYCTLKTSIETLLTSSILGNKSQQSLRKTSCKKSRGNAYRNMPRCPLARCSPPRPHGLEMHLVCRHHCVSRKMIRTVPKPNNILKASESKSSRHDPPTPCSTVKIRINVRKLYEN